MPPPALARYLGVVTVTGLVLGGAFVQDLGTADVKALGPAFWMAAVLLVVGELRPLFTPGLHDRNGLPLSTAFVFAILLRWGLPVALLTQALATVVAGRGREWWRTSFNVGQYALSYGAAAGVLALFGRTATADAPAGVSGDALPAVVLAGLAYFVVNELLVGEAVARHTRTALREVLAADLTFHALSTAAMVALSPLVAVVLERSVALVPLLLIPLFAVYRTAGASVERDREAHHDALTGLPNRRQLLKDVRTAIAEAEREHGYVAFFLLDLDRFKEINDTLGHQVGDELLTHVGPRIASVLRPEDRVGRLGGDEFAVLLPNVRNQAAAEDVAARIRRALAEPFSLGEVTLDVDASIGIALCPEHATEPELLLQRADVAMYIAKESRNGWETYSPDRDPHSRTRLGLFGQLRRAIDEHELQLYYQPKMDLATGDVVGVEALVRWPHPEHGMLGPDIFIPLAEQTGLMRLLTVEVLDMALAQSAAWAAEGIALRMSVNVSARDLHDDEFAEHVRAALERSGVPPERLELELTERVVMAEPARALDTLVALSRLGVRLSLDDFGTGYSSLAYLKRLPVTEIKIDKSFVIGMASDEDETIVRSTIDLAHGLGLKVLAEGVETLHAWERLVEMGCDAAQGYYLSRPRAAADLTTWLLERHEAAAATVVRRRAGSRTAKRKRTLATET